MKGLSTDWFVLVAVIFTLYFHFIPTFHVVLFVNGKNKGNYSPDLCFALLLQFRFDGQFKI